jgi:hypothetical protein
MSGFEDEITDTLTTGTTIIYSNAPTSDPAIYVPFEKPPIIDTIVDVNGNTELVYGVVSDEVVGELPVVEIVRNIPTSPPIIFEECTGSTGFLLTGNPTIYQFKVTWDISIADDITGYQVFWVENKISTVVGDQLQTDSPESYGGGRLFSDQSGILDSDVSEFTYKYPDDLSYVIHKLNVYVFAYNDVGRSAFPDYMVSYILYDKSGEFIRKIYKEKTTASYIEKVEAAAFNIVDDSTGKYGSLQNILESDMT